MVLQAANIKLASYYWICTYKNYTHSCEFYDYNIIIIIKNVQQITIIAMLQ